MFIVYITIREHGRGGVLSDLRSHQGLPGCSGGVQNCPCPSLNAVLWRSGPNSHPKSTVDLALMARVWVSLPIGHEYGRASPVAHLLWHGTGTAVMFPFPPLTTSGYRKSFPQGHEPQRVPHQL